MDLHVAGRMKQDTVIASVAPALAPPHDMVTMPPCTLRNPVAAVRADATLVHPESQQLPFPPEVAFHRYVEPRLKVRFPDGIERVCLLADGDMPFDRHVRCSAEIDSVRLALPAIDLSGEAPGADPGAGPTRPVPRLRASASGLRD
jgi:hypothetical protein